MNSGSSACMCSTGHSVVTIFAASWYQRSREGLMSPLPPVRLTTTTQSTPSVFASAASTLAFSGTFLPPRRPSSAVMITLDLASLMRWARLSGEKPAKNTEGMGPDPGAGQHRVGRLRDHRQIDGDAVALLDVSRAQDVGHPAHFVMQFLVG